MDAKPKSNKLRKQEQKRRQERRAERQGRADARVAAAAEVLRARRAMAEAKALGRDLDRLLQRVAEDAPVRVPLTSDLHVVARLFEGIRTGAHARSPLRPDPPALRELVALCRERTGLLHGEGADRYAGALLALSAHRGDWVRPPGEWEPRGHNAYRQFHALVRHLTARYDVPTFMDSAWLEGLTPAGVAHQRWFLHVAGGRNPRTAAGLPVPLTRRQAHLYLGAPDDFDVLAAFRRAQVLDLGGGERLARSVLATRIGVDFGRDDFWVPVLRWLVAHPGLDMAHHAPLVDYLHDRRFVPSVRNPDAHLPGRPRMVPPRPNLCMKGRTPEVLLREVGDWHRRLGRERAARAMEWLPAGFEPLRREEGRGAAKRVYATTELLTAEELREEGLAMGHCVASYAASCAAGSCSIWSLRVADPGAGNRGCSPWRSRTGAGGSSRCGGSTTGCRTSRSWRSSGGGRSPGDRRCRIGWHGDGGGGRRDGHRWTPRPPPPPMTCEFDLPWSLHERQTGGMTVMEALTGNPGRPPPTGAPTRRPTLPVSAPIARGTAPTPGARSGAG